MDQAASTGASGGSLERGGHPAEARAAAIAANLGQLQRLVGVVLDSRRWRYSAGIGHLYARVTGRRDRSEERLRTLLAEGRALLSTGVPAPSSPPAPPAAPAAAASAARGRQASRHYAYNDFAQYLNHAFLNPVMEAPYSEVDRQVLGVMDDERRRRLARARGAPAPGLVSVIMPTRNRRRLLARAIDSVLAQGYTDWELVVVDDASTDGTDDLVASYTDDRIRYLPLPSRTGVSRARNAGLARADGAYFAYLDSDNSWHPDYLGVLVPALAEAEGFEAAYCAQEIWRTSGTGPDPVRALAGTRFGPFNRSLVENHNYVDLNAFVHHRSLYERLGGFDEDLQRLVDWDLLLRYTADVPPLAVPCVLSVYEESHHDDQISRHVPWDGALRALDGRADGRPLDVPLPEATRGRRPTAPAGPVARARPRPPVTLVIPSYEALPYLQSAIASVRACTPAHRLVVVDNGSTASVQNWLRADRDLQAICNPRNLGFTAAVNQGIAAADPASDVVLLNNDALVTEGWLPALQEVLDLVPDAGLVVPRQTLFPGTRTMGDHVPFGFPDRELDVTLSIHHGNVLDAGLHPARGLVELTFAPFFCVYIPRSTIDAVGPLDAENGPHYRSDRLYCDVVRRHARRRVVYTPHAKLYHFLQRSTVQLKAQDPEHHRRMFVDNDWVSVSRAAGAPALS